METTVYRFAKKRIGSAKVSLKAILSRVVVFFTKDILRFFSNVLLPAVAINKYASVHVPNGEYKKTIPFPFADLSLTCVDYTENKTGRIIDERITCVKFEN